VPAYKENINRLGRRIEPVLLDDQNATTDLDVAYTSASTEQRQQALSEMRDHFNRMTMHKESLRKAAQHEIRASSLATVRLATGTKGTAHINAGEMKQAAHQAFQSIKNAAEAWERTKKVSREIEMSEEAFSDPTATISIVKEGIGEANDYVDRSAVARLSVRWSKTISNVAEDVAASAKKRGENVESQVRTAQNRAMKATEMTSANSGKLDTLEAKVTNAEANVAALSGSS